MGILRSTFVAAVVVTGGAGSLFGDDRGRDPGQSFVTREWTWSTGGAITTFTAIGPAEQVNAFDPQDSVLTCKGCELASSIQPSLEDLGALVEAAARPAAKS